MVHMDIINMLATIKRALQTVFKEKKYLVGSLFAALTMFTFFTLLPVGRFNERAFYYQITSLDSGSIIIMVIFSLIFGTVVSMNIYLFRIVHESKKTTAGRSVFSIFASAIAGMFGSAVCPACVALLFGFLGLPTVTLLLSYRTELFIVSTTIALVSLYLTSRAITKHGLCEACMSPKINRKKKPAGL